MVTLSDNRSTMEDDENNITYWYREDFVRSFIEERAEQTKRLFCMNPDVDFCNECWACKGVDNIDKELAGDELT